MVAISTLRKKRREELARLNAALLGKRHQQAQEIAQRINALDKQIEEAK